MLGPVLIGLVLLGEPCHSAEEGEAQARGDRPRAGGHRHRAGPRGERPGREAGRRSREEARARARGDGPHPRRAEAARRAPGDAPQLRGRVARVQARRPAAGGEEVRGEAERPLRQLREGHPRPRGDRAQGPARRHRPVRGVPPALPGRAPLHPGRDVPAGRALLRAQRGRSRRGDALLRGRAQARRPVEQRPDPPPEPAVDFRHSIALYQQLLEKFPRLQAQRRHHLPARLLPGEAERLRGRPGGVPRRSSSSTRRAGSSPRPGSASASTTSTTTTTRTRWPRRPRPTRPRSRTPRAPLYDKALYKLGWTYYRRTASTHAVQRFLAARRLLRQDRAEEGRQRPAATSAARRSSTRRSASPTRSGARWRRPRRRSPGWAAAPTRPRSTGGWATSTSTRPATPTPSTPTGWRCRRTRSPTTRRRSSRRSSRPTSATGS